MGPNPHPPPAVTKDNLNYAGVAVGIVLVFTMGWWWAPGKLGARTWFTGPKAQVGGLEDWSMCNCVEEVEEAVKEHLEKCAQRVGRQQGRAAALLRPPLVAGLTPGTRLGLHPQVLEGQDSAFMCNPTFQVCGIGQARQGRSLPASQQLAGLHVAPCACPGLALHPLEPTAALHFFFLSGLQVDPEDGFLVHVGKTHAVVA